MISSTLKSTPFIFSLLLSAFAYGQKIDPKLIKDNIAKKTYSIDSEATAVVLYEGVETDLVQELKPGGYGYYLDYNERQSVHKVIKILKKSAIEEANIHVFYRDDGNNSYIYKVKATIYNDSSGTVAERTLGKADFYVKEISKNQSELSFSFPGVKEGSIIEYSYEIVKPFQYYFPSWEVQDDTYPKLFSYYSVAVPVDLLYSAVSNIPTRVAEFKDYEEAMASPMDFCHFSKKLFDSKNKSQSSWIRKNIPASKEEPYVNSLPNLSELMQLQITGYIAQGKTIFIRNSWEKVNKLLHEHPYFGKLVTNSNSGLDEITDSITKANPTVPAQIKAFYSYVRSGYQLIPDKDIWSKHNSINKIVTEKKGTAMEKNLLLCALLVHADIDAAPLILSTTGHLSLHAAFPLYDRINYVACAVKTDSGYILLDASDKSNRYGVLPAYCYNGYARIVNDTGCGMQLLPTDIENKNLVSVRISGMSDTGSKVEIVEKHGIYSSLSLRKKWADDSANKKNFLDGELRQLPENITITNVKVDNENDPDANITISFTGTIRFEPADKWFIQTAVIKNMTKNPFSTTNRKLPIEFPYKSQYQYYTTMVLPPGIAPDSLPKPVEISLNDTGMIYTKTYNYHEGIRTLTINTRYNLNETEYPTADYSYLRDFYQEMIRQDNEMITLTRTAK